MRKIFFLVLSTVVLIIAMSGCAGDKPSSVVKKVVNAVMQKNADEVFKYLYDRPDIIKMRIHDEWEERDDSSSDGVHTYFIYSGVVKFEIQSERIFDNGEKAEVIVKSFLKSGKERTDHFQLVKTSNGWKIISRLENLG